MLLWIPPTTGLDDDEKHGKLQRETRARALKATLGFGLVTVCFCIILSLLDSPSKAETGSKLRVTRDSLFEADLSPLPLDSIYRLTVENQKGELVSLRLYSGNVTLVVNTACK
jgi:hypothetical protein